MPLRLVKVEHNGYHYELHSLFVATEDDMLRIKDWCDRQLPVEFGEIGGKHSNVVLTFDESDFKVVSEDQEFIEKFRLTVGPRFGTDIFGRMCEKCEACGEYCDDLVDDKCSYCLEEQDGD